MSRMVLIVAAAGLFLVLLGGSGAAACKFALDCHLDRVGGGDEVPPDEQPLASGAAVLPAGWREQTVVRGLEGPTDFAFVPSGDVLITQQHGLVVVATPGEGRPRTVLDLRSKISTYDIRGLLTVTVDPAFPRKPFIYLLYDAATEDGEPTTARISRFTWRGGRIDPSSEHVLVDSPVRRSHSGGEIVFAPDGTLFLSTGDGQHSEEVPMSLPAQDVDALPGKVLHVTRDGRGMPENPFWNGDPNATRSKVWAYGFRNPFRLTLEPGTNRPVVADVGFKKEEEISVVPRGSNNGWPCYEGTSPGPGSYPDTDVCKTLYERGVSPGVDGYNPPLLSLDRYEAATIIGGPFWDGGAVGSQAPLVYVFADFVYGWLGYVEYDAGHLTDEPVRFAERLPGPVALHVGKDGALYYLSASTGQLRRLERTR